MTDKLLRVAEVFGPTLQGEGLRIGQRTFFVRFGGCDYRCSWCDSLHAVLPEFRFTWNKLSVWDIFEQLSALGAVAGDWVTLSGGNPALQDLGHLLHEGRWTRGMYFAMETQGSVAKDWFAAVDHLTISPKGPSSGNVTPFADVAACLAMGTLVVELKVVVFTPADLAYAASLAARFPLLAISVSVGNANVDPAEPLETTQLRMLAAYAALAADVLAQRLPLRVLPQLHARAWGNAKGV